MTTGTSGRKKRRPKALRRRRTRAVSGGVRTAGIRRLPVLLLALSGLLNLAAWSSVPFCDWYQCRIFPLWVGSLGRLTGLAPFSVGEVMLTAGALWCAAGAALAAAGGIRALSGLFRRRRTGRDGHSGPSPVGRSSAEVSSAEKFPAGKISPGKSRLGLWRPAAVFCRISLWLVSVVVLIMTLNCFIVYHASGFSLGDPAAAEAETEDGADTAESLRQLRNYIAEQSNRLAEIVPRDAAGEVLLGEDASAEAICCLRRLAENRKIPQLQGFYPRPKGMAYSHLMSQAEMQGYYFPFSMEANYNLDMTVMHVPFTLCHELAHLKGYMREDDCNMIGFFACLESGDPAFRYSGWLGILNYVDNAYYESIGRNRARYAEQPAISKQVRRDQEFLREDVRAAVEESAVIDTETLQSANETLSDASMKANGIAEGRGSYALVVVHLLEWWQEKQAAQ
ncbi:DUF3810 domain-containing protein [Lachnoclostridium sp. Marseille-P6806]|uniref:DUF3810 domain-containing protein n=1 Tax=Lachnoclostridium sp. Marseille-P6806 TaxID=2364793 RepID=UPI0013EF3FE6|nr:DUF3810 domain-containing protein [Lachnoclostridium sp. Marseille-P6806]